MTQLALVLGSLAIVAGSGQALATPQFSLDPSSFSADKKFTADELNGSASELLQITTNGIVGSGYLQFTGASLNGNGLKGVFQTYNLYLTFQLADNGTGANGNQNVPLTKLNFQAFLDVDNNDMFNPSAVNGNSSTSTSITNRTNDVFVGFGSLISGVDGFDANGGAHLTSSETFSICTGVGTATSGGKASVPASSNDGTTTYTCASALGNTYFANPVPFYSLAFDTFNNTSQNVQRGTAGNIAITSSVGGVDFNNVPEPSTVALLGIAAAGVALASRRRKS